jgi:uncharacterized membrane protein (DUF4010 family)
MIETPLGGAMAALLIGLLFGLERQRSQQKEEELFAGIRTFPILALTGYAAAAVGQKGFPLLLPAALLVVGALAVASYLRTSDRHVGATTEALALLTPLLGALVSVGEVALAGAMAVVVTMLLTLKAPLHEIAGKVSEDEIVAILKFAIVGVIVLPLLPTDPVGPYDAIVPRHVGIVVLTMSGVSLLGYLLVRVLGGRTGWAWAGLLGGLVSSTAVTLAFSQKARAARDLQPALAVGILLASTVLYLRALVLISLFDLSLGMYLAPRLVALLAIGAGFALVQLRKQESAESQAVELGNPVELGRAIGLALLFAATLLAARAAQAELGTRGLWVAGAIGGLVDVDSVALAAARLHQQGLATTQVAGGAFLLASLMNLLLKTAVAVVVGGTDLVRRLLLPFGALAAGTIALLFLG